MQKSITLCYGFVISAEFYTLTCLKDSKYPNIIIKIIFLLIKYIENLSTLKACSVSIDKLHIKRLTSDSSIFQVTFGIQYSRDHITTDRLRMISKQFSQKDSNSFMWNTQPHSQGPKERQWNSQWMSPGQLPDQWNSPQDESEWTTTEEIPTESSRSWSWMNSEPEEKVHRSEDWAKYLKPNDVDYNKSPETFIEQGKIVSSKLSTQIPHISHVLNVQVETKPVYSTAFFRVEYNHTYSKSLQSFHVNAVMKPPHSEEAYNVSIMKLFKALFLYTYNKNKFSLLVIEIKKLAPD